MTRNPGDLDKALAAYHGGVMDKKLTEDELMDSWADAFFATADKLGLLDEEDEIEKESDRG